MKTGQAAPAMRVPLFLIVGIIVLLMGVMVTNLRQDPWERYQDESMLYGRWWGDKLWTMVPAVTVVGGFLKTFEAYPPSQRSGSLSVAKFLDAIQSGAAGSGH